MAKDFKFNLSGSFSSNRLKYINVKVYRCNQTILQKTYQNMTCANKTEIDQVLNGIELYLKIGHQYIDYSDTSDNPIKPTISSLIFSTLNGTSVNYQYKINKNIAIIKNSFLHEAFQNIHHEFYKHRLDFFVQKDLSE